MNKKLIHALRLVAVFFVGMLVVTGATAQDKNAAAIEQLMRVEEEVWNRGDVDAYVALYAPEDSVRMLYGSGAVYGRDSILAFYKKYWPKEKMGQLKLRHDCIERLSDNYYFVSGFFEVSYPAAKAVKGRFSGLMKKINGKWYIYTDHSG